MSKAFTKEDDGGEIVVGRPIPKGGALRPITARGLAALQARLAAVEAELAAADPTAPSAAMGKQALLHERELVAATIASVGVLAAPAAPQQAGFGCRVTVQGARGDRVLVLVGPDEAEPKLGRISVFSPVGQALVGARIGAEVELQRPGVTEHVQVLAIEVDV